MMEFAVPTEAIPAATSNAFAHDFDFLDDGSWNEKPYERKPVAGYSARLGEQQLLDGAPSWMMEGLEVSRKFGSARERRATQFANRSLGSLEACDLPEWMTGKRSCGCGGECGGNCGETGASGCGQSGFCSCSKGATSSLSGANRGVISLSNGTLPESAMGHIGDASGVLLLGQNQKKSKDPCPKPYRGGGGRTSSKWCDRFDNGTFDDCVAYPIAGVDHGFACRDGGCGKQPWPLQGNCIKEETEGEFIPPECLTEEDRWYFPRGRRQRFCKCSCKVSVSSFRRCFEGPGCRKSHCKSCCNDIQDASIALCAVYCIPTALLGPVGYWACVRGCLTPVVVGAAFCHLYCDLVCT